MSTDTPPLPDDQEREHTTEPAEGAESAGDGTDRREHPTEPAEGGDVDVP